MTGFITSASDRILIFMNDKAFLWMLNLNTLAFDDEDLMKKNHAQT